MKEIDVRDLMQHPGSSRVVEVSEPVAGLSQALVQVPDDAPIRGELLLESVVEGILVTGPLSGAMVLSCARCLRAFESSFQVEVSELFVMGADPGDDDYPLDPAGALDLEPMVRDAVVLSMPFSPLCRPDCRGLCERCGGDRNLGDCTCGPAAADPRWAALERLTDIID